MMFNYNLFKIVASNNILKLHNKIQKGLNVNDLIFYGESLLHCAIRCEKFKTIQYLLENGANVNIKNNHDLTPLQMAIRFHSKASIINLLLEYKADITIITKCGKSLFDIADQYENAIFRDIIRHHLISREIWNCWAFI